MSTRRDSRGTMSNTNQEFRAESTSTVVAPVVHNGQRSRITPRTSTADEAVATAAEETPYNTLRQLSAIIPRPTTPLGRASSTGPSSTRRSNRRTPAVQDKTHGAISKNFSASQFNKPTTYTQAAMKKAEINRAATLTPGKDRRQSGRLLQRETPRDILRPLSRILAPGTKPSEYSPQVDVHTTGQIPIRNQEDEYDDGKESRPRLSMPLDGDDDDSLLLPTLRSGHLAEDENLTQQSMELPRNAQLGGRLSRGSFGSIRTSDQFGELNEFGLSVPDGDGGNSSLMQQGDSDQHNNANADDSTRGDPLDAYSDDRTAPLSMASVQINDTKLEMIPPDDTEDTFVLAVSLKSSLQNSLSEEYGEPDEEDDSSEEIDDEKMEVDNQEDSEVDQVDVTDNTSSHNLPPFHLKAVGRGHKQGQKIKKRIKISKHGIQYPSLPAGVMRKLATTLLRAGGNSNVKLSKDTLDVIALVSDWFFEQVSDDLGTYAQHAGRKTIDENDIITLMKRQRQINAVTTPFALAQKYLPRELLQNLRMTKPQKLRRGRPLETLQEKDDDQDEHHTTYM